MGAGQQLQRFQRFILEDAAKKKSDADTALKAAIAVLSAVDVTYLASDTTLIKRGPAHDEALAAEVGAIFHRGFSAKSGGSLGSVR